MDETTGDQRIDVALSRLDELPRRSLDEQVQVLDEVHRTLAAVLEGADDGPAATRDEPAAEHTATSHGAPDPA